MRYSLSYLCLPIKLQDQTECKNWMEYFLGMGVLVVLVVWLTKLQI